MTVPAMEIFAGLFGEYPFIGEKFGMFSTTPGPAVEEQTMVAMPSSLITGGHQYDWVVVHELSHMWWGDCLTCRSWEHVWVNEGFASYAEALWYESFHGPAGLRSYMEGMGSGPWAGTIYDPPYIWSSIVYNKAAWVLHMLRRVIGDDGFFQFLADYRAAHEYGSTDTDAVVAAAEGVYGDDLTWFFQPWIYQEGQPTYEYAWWSSGSGPYTVHLTISQVQSTGWPTYTMPIDLEIATAGGSVRTAVFDSLRTQEFTLETAAEPTGVTCDPDHWILGDFTEVPSVSVAEVLPSSWPMAVTPNPAARESRFAFSLPHAGSVALRVFDATGRHVRTVLIARLNAGNHTAVWDGRDEAGRPVGGGVYFARLVGPPGVVERRVVRVSR